MEEEARIGVSTLEGRERVCLQSGPCEGCLCGGQVGVEESYLLETEAGSQVCFLNCRGVRPRPPASARCRITLVRGKQGLGKTGQGPEKCEEFSPTRLPPRFRICMWEAVFFLCEYNFENLKFFLQYFSIFSGFFLFVLDSHLDLCS